MSDNEDATVLLSAGGGHETMNDDENSSQQLSNDDQKKPPCGNQVTANSSSSFLYISATMAALGGLLFGYDIGIISTALPQIKSEFSLSCFQQEMVVSLMLVGALFASLVGGRLHA